MEDNNKRKRSRIDRNQKNNRGKDQKNNRGKDQKNNRREEMQFRVDTSVWKIISKCQANFRAKHPEVEIVDLDQPYYKPTDAVKMRSLQYAGMSITEAFAKAYDVAIEATDKANYVPTELRTGQVIPLRISSITKNGVGFDTGSIKQVVETRNNFYHFQNMREMLPLRQFNAKVVDVNKDRVMVDLFGPMLDEELNPIVSEPWKQNQLKDYTPVTVKNLHMVKGGFKGQMVVSGMSKFLGDDYEVGAFIPGSQICLNITDNFEKYEGQTVKAFILSKSVGPNGKESVVCSVKRYLQHLGNLTMIDLWKMWCDQDKAWKEYTQNKLYANVTGVINSSKQCGVFVEIKGMNITGMIRKQADELVNYPVGQEVLVSLADFDEGLEYNDAIGQYQHLTPFEIEDGAIKKVNIKPIFKEAE